MTPEPAVEDFCPVIEMTPEELERELAQFANERQLSSDELHAIAQRMVESSDPAAKEALMEAYIRGFYGRVTDA